VIHTKLFEDIPTSPRMKAEMTVETLEESTPLKIDADGDGNEDASLTGEEGDEEQAIVASIIILQKMIEQMDIKSFLKKQLVHDLDQAIKFLEKGNSKQAVKELEQMIKRIELQLFKDKKLIDIRNGYIERITKQKEQLERVLRERLAKYFGSMIGKNTGKGTKIILKKESKRLKTGTCPRSTKKMPILLFYNQ
jgi:hypothetical protein